MFFFWSEPVAFRRVTVLSLTRGPAGNRTTTGNLSATQECRDTNCTTRTTKLAQPACCQSLPKLELFGCCCRRLSQHGVGELLVPLRHCWRDAFFCVCVFTIGRRDAQFCFGFLMRCLFWAPPFAPLNSERGNFAGRVVYVARSSASSGWFLVCSVVFLVWSSFLFLCMATA